MDQYAFTDIWRVHEELRSIKAGQLECMETLKQHAERLAQIESRGTGDDKIRSLWGSSSPFPALTPGSAFPPPTMIPALQREPTEEFDGFDVERSNNLISSLPLDEIDVPRRGASRANSVRFDTSTLQNRWGQDIGGGHGPNSFHPADYFGHRSNNNSIAGHPMTERSMSLKSDGRHSSMKSFDNTSFYNGEMSSVFPPPPPETQRSSSTPGHPGEISIPSIIRCWVETSFSLDTILYAAVCTGSSKSTIDNDLVLRFGLQEQVKDKDGENRIALSVFLPDAVTQQRPSNPATNGHYPRIVTEFTVIPGSSDDSKIQLFLGCDILSASHADILFSQRQVVLFVEDGRQMFIPFVQPRSERFYENICTFHMEAKSLEPAPTPSREMKDALVETLPDELARFSMDENRKTDLSVNTANTGSFSSPTIGKTDSQPQSPMSAVTNNAQQNGTKADSGPVSTQGLEWRKARESRDEDGHGSDEGSGSRSSRPDRPSVSTSFGGDRSNARSSSANPRSAKEGSNSGVWDSWRKQSTSSATRDVATRTGKSGSGGSGGSQRGMKVLRASKPLPAASKKDVEGSSTEPSGTGTPSMPSLSRATSSMNINEKAKIQQRSVSGASGTGTLGHTKTRSSANVIGGASAFHWMAGQPKPTTST